MRSPSGTRFCAIVLLTHIGFSCAAISRSFGRGDALQLHPRTGRPSLRQVGKVGSITVVASIKHLLRNVLGGPITERWAPVSARQENNAEAEDEYDEDYYDEENYDEDYEDGEEWDEDWDDEEYYDDYNEEEKMESGEPDDIFPPYLLHYAPNVHTPRDAIWVRRVSFPELSLALTNNGVALAKHFNQAYAASGADFKRNRRVGGIFDGACGHGINESLPYFSRSALRTRRSMLQSTR